MFNKVLIVCDREIDIHNLNEVFGKLIQSDLSSCFILSEGPLDVLDHSANMTGYGSKLGIDLTDAFEEEKITAKNILGDKLPENRISLSQIPGIVQSRNIYSDNKKRIMLLAVSKDKKFRINTLFSKLQELTDLKSQNLFLVVDEFINIHSFREFLWYFLNNMEPQRDILRIPSNSNEAVLLIDGTSKSMENDKFRRDWPNPVVMDKKTIETIDNKWKELNLGPFIQSPSLHYQKLVQKPGARAFKNSSSQ